MKKNFLIVGAAGGIGSELSRRLVQAGHCLLLCGRSEQQVQSLGEELGQPTAVFDAQDWAATANAVERFVADVGVLDGAANLAGSLLLKPAHLTTRDDWDHTVAQNLTTALGVVRAAAPAMRQSGGGSIVLMSSSAAAIGLANHEAIAAVKAGIEGLVRAAAATYAAASIRVNAVAPGLTQTPLTERVWSSQRGAEASLAMHPLGRLGQPADIASAIAWLLSSEQSWVTGQTIVVDGGLSSLKVSQRPN